LNAGHLPLDNSRFTSLLTFVASSSSRPLFEQLSASFLLTIGLKHRLPIIAGEDGFAQLGGLIKYGPSTTENWRQAAGYVDRILKGAKPAEMPIEQPTKFELVINLKTAKELGVSVPLALLALADEVIE
jgi:putative tryptophan/tyrosine transport system substrate-binding protein